ncbi:unnamed protein product [Rotaria socialis]|uniref:Uncharacterized protein n=1 Tax=Rotaria socialis TaxID=392032 RepID=A0A818V506_9BILA|nr:unnamed protein product [Rotaria socialis]
MAPTTTTMAPTTTIRAPTTTTTVASTTTTGISSSITSTVVAPSTNIMVTDTAITAVFTPVSEVVGVNESMNALVTESVGLSDSTYGGELMSPELAWTGSYEMVTLWKRPARTSVGGYASSISSMKNGFSVYSMISTGIDHQVPDSYDPCATYRVSSTTRVVTDSTTSYTRTTLINSDN